MVELLTARRIKFASLTNGALLTGAVARHFAGHATWLRVSMDGWDDASYTAYRGCQDGEFTRIMANMAAFKKLGGQCYLGVSIVVDEQNCRHVYDLIRRLQVLGVDSVKVSPCIISNSGAANNDYHQPLFPVVKEQTLKAKADFSRPGFEIFDSYHTQLESFAKSYDWCPQIQINPVIGADLNVYSCRDKAYNLDDGLLGSIKECSFKEFWFSDRSRFFRIDPTVACNHHCVVDSSNAQIHEYLAADLEHLDFV
jgi:MoaA/NifB/PqqE/SkfB family radical SAM enzyme